MKFTRVDEYAPEGSSLKICLEGVSRRDISKLFGTWNEKGCQWPKYGNEIVVSSEEGHRISIYQSCGEYRLGARNEVPETVIKELETLIRS